MSFAQIKQFIADNSSLVNFALALFTGVYVFLTSKMARTMSKQLRSDIRLDGIMIGTCFKEDWFTDARENTPTRLDSKQTCFDFKVRFNIRNRGNASGSIDKPELLLRMPDHVDIIIPPQTKWLEVERLPQDPDRKYLKESREIVHDTGATIFLEGGNSNNIEIEYELLEWDSDFAEILKNNPERIEYYIRYNDNYSKKHELQITNVQELESVDRE